MEIYLDKQFQPMGDADFAARLAELEFAGSSPFNETALGILAALSKRLLRSKLAAQAPQLVALGYWLRPSQLQAMKRSQSEATPEHAVRVSRGIAFHLPPQNVDTLFVYSWALSLMAGNVNVVRLPSTIPSVLAWLLEQISDVLSEFDATQTQIFCRYSLDSDFNAKISAASSLRIIWGGDAKVLHVSKDPVRPDGLSLGFPDRKSFSILSAEAYQGLSPDQRDDLAARLYNDIFWFDQMGCGSPRVLFWLGDPAGVAADLYTRVDAVAMRKNYAVETSVAFSKFSYMNNQLASDLGTSGTRYSNRFSVLKTAYDPSLLDEVEGGGMLLEVALSSVDDIADFLDRHTQTITHFGLPDVAVQDLLAVMSRKGGYRLVPIGEALSFSNVWDGVSLLDSMTRHIVFSA